MAAAAAASAASRACVRDEVALCNVLAQGCHGRKRARRKGGFVSLSSGDDAAGRRSLASRKLPRSTSMSASDGERTAVASDAPSTSSAASRDEGGASVATSRKSVARAACGLFLGTRSVLRAVQRGEAAAVLVCARGAVPESVQAIVALCWNLNVPCVVLAETSPQSLAKLFDVGSAAIVAFPKSQLRAELRPALDMILAEIEPKPKTKTKNKNKSKKNKNKLPAELPEAPAPAPAPAPTPV